MIINNVRNLGTNIYDKLKNIEKNITGKEQNTFIVYENIFDLKDNYKNHSKYSGISIGTTYNFFGNISLIKGLYEKESLKQWFIPYLKSKNELLVSIPKLTPNLNKLFGIFYIQLQRELIKSQKWKKIIFSITTISQLEYIKNNFEDIIKKENIFINFNSLFYLTPTDPLFFFLGKGPDISIWNDELLYFYINKIKEYGYTFNKVEQWIPIQGLDYGNNEFLKKNIIFVGSKVVYSLTNRIYQISKLKNIEKLSILFDPENFNIVQDDINKLYEWSELKEKHIFGKYDFIKLKLFVKKEERNNIPDDIVKDRFVYYENNYQYYDEIIP